MRTLRPFPEGVRFAFLGKGRKTNRILLLCIITALLVAVVLGCRSESKSGSKKTQGKFKSKATLTIIDSANKQHSISMDDLRKLPAVSVVIAGMGSTQYGPKLRDVLKKAGVTGFKKVTLEGTRGEPKTTTLTFKQVDNKTILDFTNQGTVKLATPNLPKKEWAKDIDRIVVE